jgi:hypothetical protein
MRLSRERQARESVLILYLHRQEKLGPCRLVHNWSAPNDYKTTKPAGTEYLFREEILMD